jgi:DNA polymerase III subunit epsilon
MRVSRLERKLVLGVALLFIVPTLAAGAILFLLTRSEVFAANPYAFAATLVLGGVLLLIYLALVARAIGRWLVRHLQTIQLGAELMATVNPDHRLAIETGDEIQSLAEEINRMADRVQQARGGLEAEVTRATRELVIERGKLSAVLQSLGEGVVVVTPEGRVSLANTAAQELLGDGGESLLGRRLFDLVDREKVAYFVERLRTAQGGVERFTLHPATGAVLETAMTSFFDGSGVMIGAILVLRDVTRTARSDAERQQLFATTLRGLRGPLAAMRSLSESLLGDPASVTPVGRRMLEAIHAEAVRLSGLVREMGEPGRSGFARVPGHFETIAVADLAAMTVRRLEHEQAAQKPVAVEGTMGLPSLKGEPSALSGALAHLLRAVLRRCDGEGAWLRPAQRGTVLQFEVGGFGRAALTELESCLDQSVTGLLGGQPSVREIVRHHAGEVWAYAEGDRVGFRLLFPVETSPLAMEAVGDVVPGPRFVGAGMHSRPAGLEVPEERPDFYDFSLFDQMERSLQATDVERPLDELTCVVFDTETTGLHVEQGDRIVSIAGVKVRAGAVKRGETFDALVQPGRPIPEESARFHGITDEVVAKAPPIEVVLPAFLRFAENAVLVAHQVWFDLRFLGWAAQRAGFPPLTSQHPVLDTLVLSEIVHGPLRHHGLNALAERFGMPVHGRHSALGDALTTAEIFVRLIGLLKKRGIITLGEVIRASRRARDPSARFQ